METTRGHRGGARKTKAHRHGPFETAQEVKSADTAHTTNSLPDARARGGLAARSSRSRWQKQTPVDAPGLGRPARVPDLQEQTLPCRGWG